MKLLLRLLRRFGESDADLSLEDKMFLRFQKERVKKARNVSLFNLEGSDNVLTHKGNQISQYCSCYQAYQII
jgi:Nop14-like family